MTEKLTKSLSEIVKETDSLRVEQTMVKLINKVSKDKLLEFGPKDIQIFVKEIMPDLDRMISYEVKEHLYRIGSFIVEDCSD